MVLISQGNFPEKATAVGIRNQHSQQLGEGGTKFIKQVWMGSAAYIYIILRLKACLLMCI